MQHGSLLQQWQDKADPQHMYLARPLPEENKSQRCLDGSGADQKGVEAADVHEQSGLHELNMTSSWGSGGWVTHPEGAAVAVLHDEPGLDGWDAACCPALPLIPPGPVQRVALAAGLPEAHPPGAT